MPQAKPKKNGNGMAPMRKTVLKSTPGSKAAAAYYSKHPDQMKKLVAGGDTREYKRMDSLYRTGTNISAPKKAPTKKRST